MRPAPRGREPERSPGHAIQPTLREAVLLVASTERDVHVRLADGSTVDARVPQHVDRAWLVAALERGPIEVALAPTDAGRWVLWSVFPGPEHAEVEVEVELRGSAIRVHGSRSVEVSCGPARVSLRQDGEVRVRGKQILSRASGVNRIKGGSVRIN